MKAIIIARVSTEEQKEAGNSFPAPIARMEKYCQAKGFEITKRYSLDESAYTEDRREFDQIINFILAQKEKAVVCFDKIDRLSRNVFDKRVATLNDKAQTGKIEIHFVSEGQIINDKISAAEKFQFSMTLGLAKYYSDAISDNVKRALEQKLRKGEWPAKAPFGYRNITHPDKSTDIVVDEKASYIIQRAFEWCSTRSFSMELLAGKIREEFGRNWPKGYVAKIRQT